MPDLETDMPLVTHWAVTNPTTSISHAAHLLVAAGWPNPGSDIHAPPAVYLALLVLRAWVRHAGNSPTPESLASTPDPRLAPMAADTPPSATSVAEIRRLVAEIMAPRLTAAPRTGPYGLGIPRSEGMPTPRQVLDLGMKWMVDAGATGFAQRLAGMLDREEVDIGGARV